MLSAKRVLLSIAALITASVPLACAEDIESRDGSGSAERQLAVCNERYLTEGDDASDPHVDFDDWSVRKHPRAEGESYLEPEGEDAWLRLEKLDFNNPGTYELTIRYANGSNKSRPMMIRLNDDEQTEFKMKFPPTGGWSNWETVTEKIPLQKRGIHNITVEMDTIKRGPNIDAIEVSAVKVEGC